MALVDLNIFEIVRLAMLWISSVLFVLGLVIALYGNYRLIEEHLAKNIVTPLKNRKLRLAALEKNIFAFHEWLMNKRVMVGVLCMAFAIIFFMIFRIRYY